MRRAKPNPLFNGRETPSSPATPRQREAIRLKLRRLELPTDCITLMHTALYQAVALPLPQPGMALNAALCRLSRVQASRMIDTLDEWMEVLT